MPKRVSFQQHNQKGDCLTMFGRFLKEYRHFCQHTQEEVSNRLGITANHLSRKKKKKVQPSGKLIEKIIIMVKEDQRILNISCDNYDLLSFIILCKIDSLDTASKKIAYNELMRVLNFMETVASTQKQRSDVPQT